MTTHGPPPEAPQPPLRTALQFTAIDRLRNRLLGFIGEDEDRGRRYRLAVLSQICQSYMAWLDAPVQPRRLRKFLEKRPAFGPQATEGDSLERIAAAAAMVQTEGAQASGFQALLLCRIHALLAGDGSVREAEFRTVPAEPEYPGHRPLAAAEVAGAVERSIDWFESEGARQLHPLERSVLCLARLAEIAPFERANLPAVILASSYYLVQAGFAFPAGLPSQRAALAAALQGAAGMHTQPLIDLCTAVQRQALEELCAGLKVE